MAGPQRLQDISYVRVKFSPDPGFELNFDGLAGSERSARTGTSRPSTNSPIVPSPATASCSAATG